MLAAKVLAAFALVIGALLLGLYGLFAMSYGGDSGGGDTHVLIAGEKVDADVVGAVALLGALVLLGIYAATVIAGAASRTARAALGDGTAGADESR